MMLLTVLALATSIVAQSKKAPTEIDLEELVHQSPKTYYPKLIPSHSSKNSRTRSALRFRMAGDSESTGSNEMRLQYQWMVRALRVLQSDRRPVSAISFPKKLENLNFLSRL